MRGAPHNGFAWLRFRIKSRISAATFGLPGRRRDFRVQYHANARRCQAITVSGANDVQTMAPTGPPSREQDPQEPVGALEAQTRRRVLLENGELVTKREDLRLQCGTGSKTGGDE
jgi:hypothetical protein